MSRARNIKPGFLKNERLAECEPLARLLFIGLWMYADREGRFEYRPRRIKAELFPYDAYDVEDGIAALVEHGFLTIYDYEGRAFVQINNWTKHQNPHHKEIASVIPAPPGHIDTVCPGYIPLNNTIRQRIYARDGRVCRACGATHGLSIDHIVPVSKGGNSTDENLQVLCLPCNAAKGNKILGSPQPRPMLDASMARASSNQGAPCPSDSLIPDSGIRNPESLSAGAKAPDLPEWLDKTAWREWEAYRRERKKPLTPTTIRQQLAFLQQQPNHSAVIRQSIRNQWEGLFALKGRDVPEGPPIGDPAKEKANLDKLAGLIGGVKRVPK